VFPPGVVLYPGMLLPLHVFEERGDVDGLAGNILHTVPYVLKHSDRRDRERSVACHRCPVPHPAPDAGPRAAGMTRVLIAGSPG
jgi:hypothetical protein